MEEHFNMYVQKSQIIRINSPPKRFIRISLKLNGCVRLSYRLNTPFLKQVYHIGCGKMLWANKQCSYTSCGKPYFIDKVQN